MIDRRTLLATTVLAFSALAAGSASAVEMKPYDPALVEKEIKAGKHVVVHVYAPWCLQCRSQASILSSLKADGKLARISFFKVDYDGQKDVVKMLDCPRSTIIAYKGGKEVGRMSWGTSEADVMKIVDAAA